MSVEELLIYWLHETRFAHLSCHYFRVVYPVLTVLQVEVGTLLKKYDCHQKRS